MDDIYKNIEEHNTIKKHKKLIVFDDMIADMLSNKKLSPIVTEFFIRFRKGNISLVFVTQSYFAVPKNVRLNSTHYFIMKILDKRELQIAFNRSSDIEFKYFLNLYKNFMQNHIADDKIRDEKLQYDINREAAKISALSSGKIDKYEYLTGEKILPFNERQTIEHAKFAYSPLGRALE